MILCTPGRSWQWRLTHDRQTGLQSDDQTRRDFELREGHGFRVGPAPEGIAVELFIRSQRGQEAAQLRTDAEAIVEELLNAAPEA